MKKMNFAILGTGNIAAQMADTVSRMNNVVLYACASRTQEKSEDLANRFGVLNAYGSYASMLEDDNIDLVYVATPHSLHYEHTLLCLNKGKAVLCEKPSALNYIQAKEMIDTAREKKLLLAEAMWMRYQPMAKKICDLVDSGIIGTPRLLLANKGELDLNGFAPERAGSTLLGVGVYAINDAFLVFGNNYEDVTSTAIFEENGLDGANSIILKYANGKMAMLSSSMIAPTSISGISAAMMVCWKFKG